MTKIPCTHALDSSSEALFIKALVTFMSKKIIKHLVTTFIILPIFLGLFFVPIVNIPIFIILSLLSLPFGFILTMFTSETFIEKHFDFVFSMLGPTDYIGWTCLVVYLIIIFNLFALSYNHAKQSSVTQVDTPLI